MTLKQTFEKFDAENPQIYALFCKFVKQAYDAGRKKLSVALIIERIRWECNVTTVGDRLFKISNNHSAFYARKFHREFPEFGEVFVTHPQRAA